MTYSPFWASISVGEWAAVITITLTLLSMLAGAAWWMSSLYHNVGELVRIVHEAKSEIAGLRQDRKEADEKVWETLNDHEKRLLLVEKQR